MKISHGEKEAGSADDASFILTNRKGGFAFLSAERNTSRYQGVFFNRDWKLYKTIEDIRIGKPDELIVLPECVRRRCASATETFYTNHEDILFYEVENYSGFADLVLDCREIHDFDDKDRYYDIVHDKDIIIIEYKKGGIYIAIKGISEYEKTGRWEPRHYDFDCKRGSVPHRMHVYHAMKIKIDNSAKIVFAYGPDRHEVSESARTAYENAEYILNSKRQYAATITGGKKSTAYNCSSIALDSLLVTIGSTKGIYAGIPWFTQIWTRDEAISLGAFICQERYSDCKELLMRSISNILPDGRIPNRCPASELGSADGVGWVFLRLHELMKTLQQNGKLGDYFSEQEIRHVKRQLAKSIKRLLEHHSHDGLSTNKELETWMDTGYKEDQRPGKRIEIQALRLRMYDFMVFLAGLTGNKVKIAAYTKLLNLTREHVRQVFWHSPLLYDGDNDATVRPNVFLAYYIYPELLSKKEWSLCFSSALEKLWLDWGGLATIDKSHKYFSNEYTGENNRSYHRGDSWFFVNNLAAIAMKRVNAGKFSKFINKITEASTNEILFKGVIGYHSELSSAKELRGEASLAQAWSSATYIELLSR